MMLTRWVRFGLEVIAALLVSVTLWPLLPWWLAPSLLPLIIVATAITGDLAGSVQWAIWGGLLFDLAAPGQFSVRWLSWLVVALAVRESRRLVAIRDVPWLWPVWFGIGAGLADLPMAMLTHQFPLALTNALAAAVWGPTILGLVLWFRSPSAQRP